MEKDSKKSTTYELFYNYFMHGLGGIQSKAACLISNKQCILIDDYAGLDIDHFSMYTCLAHSIGKDELDRNFGSFFAAFGGNEGHFVVMNVPNRLSISQYSFMNDILSAYEQAREDSELSFDLDFYIGNDCIEDDIEKMREVLNQQLIKDLPTHLTSEKIFRKSNDHAFVVTHDKEFIKEEIVFNMDLENIYHIETLFSLFNVMNRTYREDPFYQDALYELFPNFDRICKFIKEFSYGLRGNVTNINLDNIAETFLTNFASNVLSKKDKSITDSFEELNSGMSLLYDYDKDSSNIPEDVLLKIEKRFPNFGMIKEILSNSDLGIIVNEDNGIKTKLGYDEISKEILNIAYREKLNEMSKIQDKIKELLSQKKQLEIEEKTEEAFNNYYPQKVESDSLIQDNSQKMSSIENTISSLKSEIAENSLIVAPESKTVFQKIRNLLYKTFNKNKIKNSEDIINNNADEISRLDEELKTIKEQNEAEKQKSLRLQMKFKSIAGREISFEEYKKEFDNKDNKESYSDRKANIQEQIQELFEILKDKESNLKELEDTGLIRDELKDYNKTKEEQFQEKDGTEVENTR